MSKAILRTPSAAPKGDARPSRDQAHLRDAVLAVDRGRGADAPLRWDGKLGVKQEVLDYEIWGYHGVYCYMI
jgi:hypothetical protein